MSGSSEHCLENAGGSTQDSKPTAGKIGNLDDPFEYAPKKPDGDHWENLLKPLFEKDKAQCNIWKDEVSNLLIFAGLFSAVVTAFIIESYKSLQRDPNQDIIILLSQIVDRIGNNTSVAPTRPSVPLPTFSPTSPSIRINIFWFISLTLSLTTVLVGIISLQWLREHQNYATLTPKEQYAIFHMRREGLEKWHVGKIFATMPLLLQSALVLFFTGMIEFLLTFDDTVAIPVAVVIGLTLLFLVATTLFPTLQGFYLFFIVFFSGGHRNIPVQCPFKSPQSNAVRAMSLPIFTALHLLNRIIVDTAVYLDRKGILDWNKNRNWKERNSTFIQNVHYSDRTWLAFDLQWLAIRDGFMRHAFNRPLELYQRLNRHSHPQHLGRVPIWDILQGLISQIHTDISSAYYAYMEVSDTTISTSANFNAYLYDAVTYGGWNAENDICFDDFFERFSNHVDHGPLARYQALYTFVDRTISKNGYESVATRHMAEIFLRLMEFLFTQFEIPVRPQNRPHFWPDCLLARDSLFDTTNLQTMLLQLTTTLFKEMSSARNALVHVYSARRKGIVKTIGACWGLASNTWHKTDHTVQREVFSLVDIINESLVQELRATIVPGSGNARATLLFYAAALFTWEFTSHEAYSYVWRSSFQPLLSTIRQYKDLTIDKGMFDPDIENQLNDGESFFSTFSALWWSHLLQGVPPLDSCIINDLALNNTQPLPRDTSSAGNAALTPAEETDPHVSIAMDRPTELILE